MMIKALYILSFFSFLNFDHDIHVSVCDIELKKTSIEVTVKTFIDDLQVAVGLRPGEEVPVDYTSSDDIIAQYLSSTISLQLGNQMIDLKVDDISASNDAVWITLTSDSITYEDRSLSLVYSLLTELYNDQTNIINITHKETKETYSLNHKKKKVNYELD